MKPTYAVIALVLLWAGGCAAPIQNLTKTQYIDQSLTGDVLREGGVALLPITAGQGQEGYRRPLGEFFNARLPEAVPGGRTLTWQASMDSLNRHGLVAEYQQMIESYQSTSILDRERVKKLGSSLGVRFALFCALEDFSEKNQTSYNIFTGLQTTTTANVAAHCLILDLDRGDVVQEIQGRATSKAGTYEHSSPYESYALSVAESVLMQIPGSAIRPTKARSGRSSDPFSTWPGKEGSR